MNEITATIIYAFSGFLAALSQMILKMSAANAKPVHGLASYFDRRIIFAYTLLIGTLFLNMIAMRYVSYKYIPVLSSLSYVFVLLLGRFILHENLDTKRILGINIIFLGMIVFYLG